LVALDVMQASASFGSDLDVIEASTSLEDDFDVMDWQHLCPSHQGDICFKCSALTLAFAPPGMVAGKVLGLHVVSKHNQTALGSVQPYSPLL